MSARKKLFVPESPDEYPYDDPKDPYKTVKRELRSMNQDSTPTKLENRSKYSTPAKSEKSTTSSSEESDDGSIDVVGLQSRLNESELATALRQRQRELSRESFQKPVSSSNPPYANYSPMHKAYNSTKSCISERKATILILCNIAACLMFIYMSYFFNSPTLQDPGFVRIENSSIPWSTLRTSVKIDLKELEKKFPSQSKSTIIGLHAAASSTMTDDKPKQPSCIILLSKPKVYNPNFATCFAQNAGMLINKVFEQKFGKGGEPLIFTKSFSDRNMTTVHKDLKDYLDKKGKAVVVPNAGDFTNDEHLNVFHSFCDNLMAYDTRAFFIYTATVPEEIYSPSGWVWENGGELSYATLTTAWKNLSRDKIPAIIARIATTVILLEENDSCSFP